MPETIIESVLNGKLDSVLLIKWLNNEPIEDDCVLLCCKKSEFVDCFLSYLRNQTDSILLPNSNVVQILQNTPENLNSQRKHHRSISDPTNDDRDSRDGVKNDSKNHESPNDRKRAGRRVKTKLFSEDHKDTNISVSSDESRLSTSIDRIAISSTPLKNGIKPSDYPNLPFTSPVPKTFKDHDRCDTPRLSHRHSRSNEKSCLGDFIVTATKNTKKKGKKSVDNEDKVELDLSNSEMFPEIGARKSSSLRSDKKRIKPTNIDKSQKSLSLNSFNHECFQQVEENSAFKLQNFQPKETANFEAERSILKQERHKLMEKFNILNTAPQKVTSTPQIKITRKETIEINQSFIKADATKVLFKDTIDILIDIYDNLLQNNLILSVVTEIYFLISILISTQNEDDYLKTESKLNQGNLRVECLLKSIHNSCYFAVKSLWNLRTTLEVILDKNSFKTLGENKNVRSFFPELAKFLLNCYCVHCEAPPPPLAGGSLAKGPSVVCYNTETDSADNFPTTQAFHNFKKQRDMFYEIVRWYQETQSTGGSKSTLRARIKALTSHSVTSSNHAHLASLFVAHMLAECLPVGGNTQESKLSKLHRRLTCPTAPESHRLPSFAPNHMFYKEFIINAENESFRVHLRDALSTEIIALDATTFAVEDRASSNNMDISREYTVLAKKLILLSKFLGLVTALAHSASAAVDVKNGFVKDTDYSTPKEKVLENSIAMRNYSQPSIDLQGILQNAIDNHRLSLTIPWIVNYLSMLDYTTLHLNYYQKILKNLLQIYHTKLKSNEEQTLKKNTIIYLKSILGWLFDLPHYSDVELAQTSVGVDSIDSYDLLDECILDLCPPLRDVHALLATRSSVHNHAGTRRHITPVSVHVDVQARTRNKEIELQARLEEELVKSQPSSSRRVLEMVIERVTSSAVRELSARELCAARARAREDVARALARTGTRDHSALLSTATSIYTTHLHQLRTLATESARAPLAARTRAALTALLPAAPLPLQSVACRAARNRLNNWINDHWNTTAVLCKDIESEMKTLLSLNDMRIPSSKAPTPTPTSTPTPTPIHTAPLVCDESPAAVLIHLKEHICLVLECASAPLSAACTPILEASARACAPTNALCRPPALQAILQLTVDLCLVYVSKKPADVTEPFLTKLHTIWNTCCPDRKHYTPLDVSYPERREGLSPDLRNFTDDRLPTPVSDEEIEDGKPIILNPQPIDLNTQPISPITKVDSQKCANPKSKSNPVTPLKRITPITYPMSPNIQSISPKIQPFSPKIQQISPKQAISPKMAVNSIYSYPQPVDSKSHPIDSKSHPIDLINTKSELNKQSDLNISQVTITEENKEHLLEFFDRILCPRNIVLLSSCKDRQSQVWESLANVLVFLLNNDYLCEDSLTEQCLAVYRQDWPQSVLERLSTCMKAVSSKWSRSAGKFTLFLDFLAEYCGDMDINIAE